MHTDEQPPDYMRFAAEHALQTLSIADATAQRFQHRYMRLADTATLSLRFAHMGSSDLGMLSPPFALEVWIFACRTPQAAAPAAATSETQRLR